MHHHNPQTRRRRRRSVAPMCSTYSYYYYYYWTTLVYYFVSPSDRLAAAASGAVQHSCELSLSASYRGGYQSIREDDVDDAEAAALDAFIEELIGTVDDTGDSQLEGEEEEEVVVEQQRFSRQISPVSNEERQDKEIQHSTEEGEEDTEQQAIGAESIRDNSEQREDHDDDSTVRLKTTTLNDEEKVDGTAVTKSPEQEIDDAAESQTVPVAAKDKTPKKKQRPSIQSSKTSKKNQTIPVAENDKTPIKKQRLSKKIAKASKKKKKNSQNEIEEVVSKVEATSDEAEKEASVAVREAESAPMATEKTPSSSSSSTLPSRPRPPNPLYIFLLRRGWVGHVLVMALILCVEWIQAYIPPLARFLVWTWTRLVPYREPSALERAAWEREDQGAAVIRSTRRTGQSSQQRRALTKQADQAALAQLQRVGNAHQAKYRHVSLDFLSRHGLGPFAKAADSHHLSSRDREQQQQLVVSTADEGKRSVAVKYDEEGEDVEWVVQALTSERPGSRQESGVGDSFVKPSVSVGLGSDGVSVGVEFQFGRKTVDRRQAVTKAVTSARRKKRTGGGPRASDRDGGDGIFGRIRAAAGTDSMLSRNLLGAYPGDAVPPSEAGSAEGVTLLAQKYGWGDWSDDDEEEEIEDLNQSKSRRKKRRRKKRQPSSRATERRSTESSSSVEVEFSLNGGQSRGPLKSARKRRNGPRGDRTVESSSSRVPLSVRNTDFRPAESKVSSLRRRNELKPATARISELRNKSKKPNKDEN